MKKYSFVLIFIFFLTIVAVIANGFIIANYMDYAVFLEQRNARCQRRLDTFEKNSLLFQPYDNIDESALYKILSETFGEDYIGKNPLRNTLHSCEGVRIVSDFMFDKKYLWLIEGRMPDLSKKSINYTEVLIARDSSYNIGQTFNLSINTNDGRKIDITCEAVGIIKELSFPYPVYDGSSYTAMVMPDLSEETNFALLSDQNEVYLTFKDAETRDEAFEALNDAGIMIDYKLSDWYYEDTEKVMLNERKTDLVFMFVTILAVFVMNAMMADSLARQLDLKKLSLWKQVLVALIAPITAGLAVLITEQITALFPYNVIVAAAIAIMTDLVVFYHYFLKDKSGKLKY